MRSPLLALARVQVFMGLAALATLPAYNYAFDFMASAMAVLPRDGAGYFGFNVVGYVISAGIMVPAAFFAGMTLPLLTFILYSQGRGEADIGAVYGWNTLGAIAGTALGGLLLMPLMGLKNLLVAGASVDIALGLALTAVLFRRRELSAPRAAAALAAISIIAVTATVTAFDLDAARTASGVFRYGRARISEGSTVAFHADGRTATVDVVSNPNETWIATNGKPDASINMARARGDAVSPAGPDEYTMTLLGSLPLTYAPGARRVAVIGHGSGLTTHVVLASPLDRACRRDRDRARDGARCAIVSASRRARVRRPTRPDVHRGRTRLLRAHIQALRHHRLGAVEPLGERRRLAVHAGVLPPRKARPQSRRAVRPVVPRLRERSVTRSLDRARNRRGILRLRVVHVK